MRNRSTAATVARALLALVTLLAILAGVPFVLLSIGVLPDHIPSIDEVTTALTSPDTGTLFLGAVTLIGWYGWLTFLISVVLETAATLRHRRAPQIRLLGGSQQLAGALVGGILILLPAGTAFASPASASPAPSATAVTAPASAGAQTTAKSASQNTWDGPVHQVRDGDTLWDIAEERLGAGIEWHRIVEANKGVPQKDGSVITADTTLLQAGWVLRLPAGAAPSGDDTGGGTRAQTAGTSPQQASHTVEAGETLSAIAEDELGDADDYPQIVNLNKGVRQPDGRTLTNPDTIHPGWKLRLPAAAASDSNPDAKNPVPPQEPKPAPDADRSQPEHEEARPSGQGQDKHQRPGKDTSGAEAGKQDQDGAHSTARPEAPAEPPAQNQEPDEAAGQAGTEGPAEQAPQEAGAESRSVTTVAAVGSILAAAVLSVIAARRVRQQRRRRAKRRIPMPTGSTADFETQLRAASDITGTVFADRALRTLAANCRRAGRPLPEVEAMRIGARGVELHLAAATPPVAPFTEREESPSVWWCAVRGASLLDDEQAADVASPYPALVSLGVTEDGDAVLVDLENIGLLRLAGDPDEVQAVMLALAVELASSKLAADIQLVLVGAGSDLHQLYPDQVEHHTDLAAAAAELQAHDAFQRDALAESGHDHLRSARLDEETSGDSWVPRILLATAAPSGPAVAVLDDLLNSRPRTSVAVVTAADQEADLPGTWTLPAQPGALVELPGLDLAVKLQYLEAGAYNQLVHLLATSSRADDVPPPAWTGHTTNNGPQRTSAAPEEVSALSAETSGIAIETRTSAVAPAGDLATALPDFSALASYAPSHSTSATSSHGPFEAPVYGDASALSLDVVAPAAHQATVVHGAGAEDVPSWGSDDRQAVGRTTVSGSPGSELLQRLLHADPSSSVGASPFVAVAPGHAQSEPPYAEGPGTESKGGEGESALSAAVLDQHSTTGTFATPLSGVLEEKNSEPDKGEAESSALSAAALGASSVPQAPSGPRIVPRPSAATSNVLAALATPPAAPTAPQVQVLGPVQFAGTRGRTGSNRHNSLLEIAAWLVLHPSLSRKDLDEAIWPGMRITAKSRNTTISRLRSWVGNDPRLPADDPQAAYLPPIKGGIYVFNDDVTSDWGQFQELYQQGMHHDGQEADLALAQALALVRGRPFADVDPSRYVWAEADIQEMISSIVDVAHELAERRRQVRDYRAAAQAVTKGMTVDSQSELLYRDLFSICHEMGDREGLKRAAHQLARINAEEGCDSSPETVGLLRTLLKGEQNPPTLGSAAS